MRDLRSKILSTAAAMLIGASVAAVAANTTFFTSIGDLIFPFSPPKADGSAGTIDNMTIGATTPRVGNFTQVNSILGSYAKDPASVATYASYQFADTQGMMIFSPSGTASYAYVTLAANPIDGWQACVFSTQAITTLYLNASPGQTLLNAITTLSANARVCYTYSLANKTWSRSQ